MAVDRQWRPQLESRITPIVMLIAAPSTSTHRVERIVLSHERCRATFSHPAWTTAYHSAASTPTAMPSVVDSWPGSRTNTMLVDRATANGAVR